MVGNDVIARARAPSIGDIAEAQTHDHGGTSHIISRDHRKPEEEEINIHETKQTEVKPVIESGEGIFLKK